jgi:hypothetical protein
MKAICGINGEMSHLPVFFIPRKRLATFKLLHYVGKLFLRFYDSTKTNIDQTTRSISALVLSNTNQVNLQKS